jgi:hypothetical protein
VDVPLGAAVAEGVVEGVIEGTADAVAIGAVRAGMGETSRTGGAVTRPFRTVAGTAGGWLDAGTTGALVCPGSNGGVSSVSALSNEVVPAVTAVETGAQSAMSSARAAAALTTLATR